MDSDNKNSELNHLFWKDEILQVLYWMYGEGLGSKVSVAELKSLLNTPEENLDVHLNILVEDGFLNTIKSDDTVTKYELSETGRKEGGQRFAGAFQGLQKAGHGECGPDCDCQWEGKDSCQHHIHHENCNH